MWILEFMLFLIALIIMAAVVIFNGAAEIETFSLGFTEFNGILLSLVVFVTFLAGAFWAFLFAIIMDIKLRLNVSKYKKQAERLKQELNRSRTKPIEDVSISEE